MKAFRVAAALFAAVLLVSAVPASAFDENDLPDIDEETGSSSEADSGSDEEVVSLYDDDTDGGGSSSSGQSHTISEGERYDPEDGDDDSEDATPLWSDGTVTSDAHFRSGPSTKDRSLGILPKGTEVLVTLVTDSGWYKVTYNGQKGYVSEDLVTLNAKEEYSGNKKASAGRGLLISDAYFRSSPDKGDNIIAGLSEGTEVEILDETDSGWYEVRYNGVTGYIYNGLVDDGGELADKGTTTGGVHFRTSPDPDADNIIATIPAGTTVTILDETYNHWYKIRYRGETGYIYGSYVN